MIIRVELFCDLHGVGGGTRPRATKPYAVSRVCVHGPQNPSTERIRSKLSPLRAFAAQIPKESTPKGQRGHEHLNISLQVFLYFCMGPPC